MEKSGGHIRRPVFTVVYAFNPYVINPCIVAMGLYFDGVCRVVRPGDIDAVPGVLGKIAGRVCAEFHFLCLGISKNLNSKYKQTGWLSTLPRIGRRTNLSRRVYGSRRRFARY